MISDKIKELRNRTKMSQTALAKELHVSRSTINSWEMDVSMPTIRYVIAMSQIFRVTSDYILGIDNSETINLNSLNREQIQAIMQIVDCFNDKH